jgi:hypothetical protein
MNDIVLEGIISFNHYLLEESNDFVKNLIILGTGHYSNILPCKDSNNQNIGTQIVRFIQKLSDVYKIDKKDINVMLEINEDRVKKIYQLNDINLSNLYKYSVDNNISMEYIDPRFQYFPALTSLYKRVEEIKNYKLDTFIKEFLLAYENYLNDLYYNIAQDEDENVRKYIDWFNEQYERFINTYVNVHEIYMNDINYMKNTIISQSKIKFKKEFNDILSERYEKSDVRKISLEAYIDDEMKKYIDITMSKIKLNAFLAISEPRDIIINGKNLKIEFIDALKLLWTDITDLNVIYRCIKSRKSNNILLIGEKHAEKLLEIFSSYNKFSTKLENKRDINQCISLKGFYL